MKIRNVKKEKGSITLYVLVSMIFFVILLMGIYIRSSNKIQKQQADEKKIQTEYTPENVDDIYNETVDKKADSDIRTSTI